MKIAIALSLLVAFICANAAETCADAQCLNDRDFDQMAVACSEAIIDIIPKGFKKQDWQPLPLNFNEAQTISVGVIPDQGVYFGGVLMIEAESDGTTATAKYMCRYTGGTHPNVAKARISLIGSKLLVDGRLVSEIDSP